MSRPNWSVPNHQRAEGGRSRFTVEILSGSPTKDGPITATAISSTSRTAPKVMVGLRRIALASENRRGGIARSSATATILVPDPWIEEGVGNVDQQVDQHL